MRRTFWRFYRLFAVVCFAACAAAAGGFTIGLQRRAAAVGAVGIIGSMIAACVACAVLHGFRRTAGCGLVGCFVFHVFHLLHASIMAWKAPCYTKPKKEKTGSALSAFFADERRGKG